MEALSNVAYSLSRDLERKEARQERSKQLLEELGTMQAELAVALEGQKLLGAVADEKSRQVLNYVTQVLNKTLAEIFPHDHFTISLENRLHAGKYPHINVVLKTADGRTRDLVTQSGTGLRQIVSFLYRMCLIEVTGSRKLIVMDELLSGVHEDAIEVLVDLMQIFVKGGFQFVAVDYALPARLGMTYLVEKEGPVATIRPLDVDDEAETHNVEPELATA